MIDIAIGWVGNWLKLIYKSDQDGKSNDNSTKTRNHTTPH